MAATGPNLALAPPVRSLYTGPHRGREVSNRGVAPDIEVELDPQAVRAGRDPQLEKAVEVALEALKKEPPPERRKPPYRNYHRTPARTSGNH